MILTVRIRLIGETFETVKTIMTWIARAYSHATFEVLSWTVEKEEST